MQEVLVNRLGGLSLPRKSVVRLTDRPDMTLDVYRGRKTTITLYDAHVRRLSRILSLHMLLDSYSSEAARLHHLGFFFIFTNILTF